MTSTTDDVPTIGKPYAIRRGDTISSIAHRAFGDARRYPEIYAFNRVVIGPKPTHLTLGLIIQIPTPDYLIAPRSLFGRGTVGRTIAPAQNSTVRSADSSGVNP